MKLLKQKHILIFSIIAIVALLMVIGIMQYWYSIILNLHEQRLQEIVYSTKNMINADYERQVTRDQISQKQAFNNSILFVKDGYKNSSTFGYDSEFIVAEKINGVYYALFKSINGQPFTIIEPLADQTDASIFTRAFRGTNGVMVHLNDYDVEVISAFDFLDLGDKRLLLVGSVPYSEVTKAKYTALISAVVLCLILYVCGGVVFFFLSRSSFNELSNTHKELETFGYVMNSANELISYIGTDGRYIAVNESYQKTFGVPRENITGMHLMEFHGINRYNNYLKGALERCLEGKEVKLQQWYDFMGGYRKFFEMSFVPHVIDGDVQGVVMTANDITELETAKLELLERTRDLHKLTLELEEKIKLETDKRLKNEQIFFEQKKFADMGQMINAIAHQWRQPINALGLYIQYFISSSNDDSITQEMLDEFQRDSLNLIQHLSKTIDDFRSFFEPLKEKVAFPLLNAVNETLSIVNIQLREHKIEYEITCSCNKKRAVAINEINQDCEECEIHVSGFPSEFKQVLLNLIQNAKDAMENQKELKSIKIDIISSGENVTISVCDSGGGIDEKIMSNIFDPYFTTKMEGKGTGIGL